MNPLDVAKRVAARKPGPSVMFLLKDGCTAVRNANGKLVFVEVNGGHSFQPGDEVPLNWDYEIVTQQ